MTILVDHKPRANGDLVSMAGMLIYVEDAIGVRRGTFDGFDGTVSANDKTTTFAVVETKPAR